MAKIRLKKVKLEGNWPSGNHNIDIRFLNFQIGAPIDLSKASGWVDYPPNTTFFIPGVGNLWQYLNGAYNSMCTVPLDDHPTQTNVEAVIRQGSRETYVKYDIIP